MKEDISKSIKYTMYIIEVAILIYAMIIFYTKDQIPTLIYPINVSFFMALSFISYKFLGYKKNKRSRSKTKITNTFIICSAIYLIVFYLLGNLTNFTHSNFNIINLIYLTLFAFFIELFRYIFLNKCSKKTYHHYLITFAFIIFDIFALSIYSINNFYTADFLISTIIISVIKNSILSYTTYKYGFYPCLIYTFILTIMPLISPLQENVGTYINLTTTIIYSAILLYHVSKPTRKTEEETVNTYKRGILYYLERVTLVIIVFIIILVSGNFKYSISAIASDSMYPELKKGDAIILEKIDKNNTDEIKEGAIVAFEEDGFIITHRILQIDEENGIEYITTKGDNNSTKDVQKKTKDDIIGIVRFKIPLLGYPSVEISEIKN